MCLTVEDQYKNDFDSGEASVHADGELITRAGLLARGNTKCKGSERRPDV